jgi:DNA primase
VERKLLMMVAQRPELALRVPVELLSCEPAHTEAALLRALQDVQQATPLPAGALGQIMERFRGSAYQDAFAELIGEIEENYFDAETLEAVFNDSLERLRQAAREKEFAALNEKATKGGLSAEDLLRYRQLLLQKQQTKKELSETDL